MPSFRGSGRQIWWVVLGAVLLAVGVLAFSQVPVAEYRTVVEPADVENPSEIGYGLYEFDELSSEGKAVFLAARNTSDGEISFTDSARVPPEFRYPDDTQGAAYVGYEDRYYLVSTTKWDCFAALCDMARVVSGLVALAGLACAGYGLWLRKR